MNHTLGALLLLTIACCHAEAPYENLEYEGLDAISIRNVYAKLEMLEEKPKERSATIREFLKRAAMNLSKTKAVGVQDGRIRADLRPAEALLVLSARYDHKEWSLPLRYIFDPGWSEDGAPRDFELEAVTLWGDADSPADARRVRQVLNGEFTRVLDELCRREYSQRIEWVGGSSD